LALRGGSNGGLLVGAVMTQRPDLFQVALPAVGVLDMLRYHTFTAGAGWAYDYGTSEQSKEMFDYLKGYSPVHNVKKGTRYPATTMTIALFQPIHLNLLPSYKASNPVITQR
jgi:prolyl oligopeptidase